MRTPFRRRGVAVPSGLVQGLRLASYPNVGVGVGGCAVMDIITRNHACIPPGQPLALYPDDLDEATPPWGRVGVENGKNRG